ncbi:ATP-binding cassette domain-containing protein [Curtobacterium pusillum]|uniref:ATP-binding cassette domain-containing protein n=1 Tax=Curtobacterium pusillum TaxID=69373 RepID=A0AAW3T954_9MICO|nr:ATP-binding cassette domain-containing protein [Curtobacterium pusillum]MBA8990912.1 molybdate transport system ATP-binding protein [Curtobacterium pusillum]NUU14779.1 ATP-binding cassette domain-containing protein [Curtobacterium pusillum]GLK31673.1 ABC transporter ATP-binding protein [Curtobacterium pusillum]
MSVGLRAHVVVPSRDVDVRLDIGPDECVALIGPNGAGKSTVVEALAGLLRVRTGEIVLGGRVLTGVPPHRRGVGLVAQRADLFPHLSVARNVAYGPRASGLGGLEARHRSAAALAAVGVAGLADRVPGTLSGGQAQRVAIARALATAPALLLLDEPTSALDVDARAEVRAALRTARTGRPTLLVTHDPLEAVTLADRVVVLEHGRIAEQGTTAAVFGRPTSAFAASFSGLTLVRGTGTGDGIALDDGGVLPSSTGTAPPDGPAIAVYHPTAAVVTRDGAGPERVVTALEPREGLVRVRAGDLVADVTVTVAAALGLVPGDAVRISVPADEVTVYQRPGARMSR